MKYKVLAEQFALYKQLNLINLVSNLNSLRGLFYVYISIAGRFLKCFRTENKGVMLRTMRA